MLHSTPDLEFFLTMVLMYLGLFAGAAVVVVAVRWWRRRSDPHNMRSHTYSEQLTGRFEKARARASKARNPSKGRHDSQE